MKRGMGIKKYENCILTLIVMAVNVLLMGILFDFYYDLNDDTMMHDIMSGIYSGIPDGHNMQTLYPLGAFIALCYRMCGSIPWYGLFLCLCQFGCFYLIGVRLCGLWEDTEQGGSGKAFIGKVLCLLVLSLFQWGIWLSHLINVQYTVTCAMLSATAIFLFITTAEGLNTRQFVLRNIPSVVLVIVAYMLRSEMLLLTFPFICLAGLYRLTEEKKVFAKENLIKYGSVLGIMLVGMVVVSSVDYVAYGSAEWRDFRDFFDARTTIYDFYQELVTDDTYSESLTQLGVTPARQTLLRNYNFGLDDSIDKQLLTEAANYASGTLRTSKDWAAIARDKIYFYIYRTTHNGDAPYNVVVIWAYIAVFVLGILLCVRYAQSDEGGTLGAGIIRRFAFVWQLILLAFVRSALWMFILLRGRDPERITHSLYLVEFALLAAMFVKMLCRLRSLSKNSRVSLNAAYGLVILFALMMAVGLTDSVSDMRADQEFRAQINQDWYAIDAYCRERSDSFYFEDVYSTVDFSWEMFRDSDNSIANYDIMGGWICKSPLYEQKLEYFGMTSMEDGLVNGGQVYLIMNDTLPESNTDWLKDYYYERNISVEVSEVDRIGESYGVYRVREVQ